MIAMDVQGYKWTSGHTRILPKEFNWKWLREVLMWMRGKFTRNDVLNFLRKGIVNENWKVRYSKTKKGKLFFELQEEWYSW